MTKLERLTREEIEAILDRVRTWPLERREEAAQMLLALEERGTGFYELSPEEEAEIDEALAEVERGEVASDEEVAAFFNRVLK
jgi:predicted transcriptional regulator